MADGTNSDPIILDPMYRFAWASLTGFFSNEGETQKLLRAVSPMIRSSVSPGQCFAFAQNAAVVFLLRQGSDDALYFVRWPGLAGTPRFYLENPEDEKPWLQDRINELNRRVKELNPFSAIDDFMK